MKIDSFSGKHRFLSNFYPCNVEFDMVTYPTVEHAYQAAKTMHHAERRLIEQAGTPGAAKRLGKLVTLRKDWKRVKIVVMLELLRKKFASGAIRDQLLATGDTELTEGNTWGDRFWGVCGGIGENMLGKLLMQVREELRSR